MDDKSPERTRVNPDNLSPKQRFILPIASVVVIKKQQILYGMEYKYSIMFHKF